MQAEALCQEGCSKWSCCNLKRTAARGLLLAQVLERIRCCQKLFCCPRVVGRCALQIGGAWVPSGTGRRMLDYIDQN